MTEFAHSFADADAESRDASRGAAGVATALTVRRFVERAGLAVLLRTNPERAHAVGLRLFRFYQRFPIKITDPRLGVSVFGLDFPNPVGAAAGIDKHGLAVPGILAAGFGFCEVGTVTPLPQEGNPSRPRVIRFRAQKAVINSYGFNSHGFDAVHARLESQKLDGLVGLNIGANRDSTDRVGDYVRGIEKFADIASYFTLNLSSPNTPGLRDLQKEKTLIALLRRTMRARDDVAEATGRRVPLLVKLAPDLDSNDLESTARSMLEAEIDGAIMSNTTLSRDGISGKDALTAGGLSGAPLFRRATQQLAKVRSIVGRGFPLIGVGGIDSEETAWDKFAAGADLIQLHTGLFFHGPSLVESICRGLIQRLDARGLLSIRDAVGLDTDRWVRARD